MKKTDFLQAQLTELENRLNAHERCSALLPGEGVRISETPMGTLIEVPAGTEYTPPENPPLETAENIVLLAGRGIVVEQPAPGCFQLQIAPEYCLPPPRENIPGTRTDTEDFPFRVKLLAWDGTAAQIQILCGRESGAGIYAGCHQLSFDDDMTFSITGSRFAVLTLTRNSEGGISAEISMELELPEQTVELYSVPLAHIGIMPDGMPVIRQFQWGTVFVSGRVI